MEQIASYTQIFLIPLILLFIQSCFGNNFKSKFIAFVTALVIAGLWFFGNFIDLLVFIIGIYLMQHLTSAGAFNKNYIITSAIKIAGCLYIAEGVLINHKLPDYTLLLLFVIGGFFPLHDTSEYRKNDKPILITLNYYLMIIVSVIIDKINLRQIIPIEYFNNTLIYVLIAFIGLFTTRNTGILLSQQLKMLYGLYFVENFLIILPCIAASICVNIAATKDHKRITPHLLALISNIITAIVIRNYSFEASHLFYSLIAFDIIVFLKFRSLDKLDWSFSYKETAISIISILFMVLVYSLNIKLNFFYLAYAVIGALIFASIFKKYITRITFDFNLLKIIEIFEDKVKTIKYSGTPLDIKIISSVNDSVLKILKLNITGAAAIIMVFIIASALLLS